LSKASEATTIEKKIITKITKINKFVELMITSIVEDYYGIYKQLE